jgi:hypothetical protein
MMFDSLPSTQSDKTIKMMSAWYQATAPNQTVSNWASMGLIPFRGPNRVGYLRVDRAYARTVGRWGEGAS